MPTPARSQAQAKAKAQAPAVAPVTSRPLKAGDHLFLVDGSGYIYRAYHALPPLTRKSDGLQVNAVLGFCNMLWKLLREMPPDNRPTHLAVVFDLSEKTFRTEMYTEYKANRSAAPDDLIPQFPLVREAVRAFDIPCLEQAGFEADDLIATYARLACEAKATTTIVSSDKDLMQLVCDTVTLYDTMKDKRIGRAEVIEKFGVGPEKVIEVQSLIGDTSDNVPGVPGIGVKTAAQLIIEYGDLETLLMRAGEIKQEKRRQSLIEHAEAARMSKKLVTLDQNVDLEVPVADLAVHEPDYKNLVAFLKAMEFTTLTRRVVEQSGVDASAIEPSAKVASHEVAVTSPPPPAALSGCTSAPGGGASARRSRPGGAATICSRPHSPALPRTRREGARERSERLRPPSPSPRPAPHGPASRRSTAPNTRPCARSTGSTPGLRAPRTWAWWRSIARPPTSIRCRRISAASRWQSATTRSATCRSAIATAAPGAAATCSRPIRNFVRARFPKKPRSLLSSRCWKTPACSRSARTSNTTG